MRKLFALALVFLSVSGLRAQSTLYSTTNFSGWFLGTKPSVTGGSLVTTASTTNAALVYFETPGNQYNMTTGETLTLSADFTMASGTSNSSSRTFYLTLQNSNSTNSTNNQVTGNLTAFNTNALFSGYTGYGLLTNPGPTAATAGQFDARTASNTAIVGSTTPWTLPGTPPIAAMSSTTFTLDSSHNYNIAFTIKDVSSTEIDFTYTLTNTTSSTTLASYSAAATGLSGTGLVTSFDTIALGDSAAQTSSYKFLDVSLASSVPEPSTYAIAAGILALGVAAWRRRSVPRVA